MTVTAERPAVGYGSHLRKEDARFVRGHGTYVDDVKLPGMLYGAILRSPYAHARILSIDTSAAEAHPKVKAVITGETLKGLNLAWMPTLSYDVQAVLATDKVRYQGQEVAFVIAEDKYSARDALELIEVDYEPLTPVIDARQALESDAPVIRDDKEGKTDNHIFDWEAGDAASTDEVFANAEVVVAQDMLYPRVHPAPLETCGAVADFDKITGKLTVWTTSQAPHAHRTVYALVAGLPEHKIRIISPDIGGGFGNKVGIYPGYVAAIVGSIVTGKPVKWVEDRSEHLMSTAFARDYHMRGEVAATRDGKILGLRVNVIADHGAFNATAQPTKFPAGFFHVFTGSYDLQAAHCKVTGVYTNKAPGGVAYACSFRITEAVYLVERMVDVLAYELGVDPAELRMKNLLRPEQFPYTTATGWEYDSGDYPRALEQAMAMAGYADLRREQAEQRARHEARAAGEAGPAAAGRPDGTLMGIGVSFFTEAVGAGPRKHMDILGLGMADGAELRVHPTGKAVLRISVQTQGQGHETTFAQIVGQELGIPTEDIEVVHGDTDQTPFGLGTYGSRSTPVSGAATAVVARRVRERARIVASAALEVSPDDLEWEDNRWQVRGDPEQGKTIQELALLAHSNLELPEGVEGHLDATCVYNPPNLTYPFGAYICVVDVDPGTGQVKVRRFIAVDDCGIRINPMIVEGQVHGGLADGVGMALMQVMAFDRDGNHLGASLMDYLLPTAMECPSWELGMTVTPSPHHPIGAKGIGESATVGSPAAIVNAVMDALRPYGVRHADMPLTPAAVWEAIQGRPLRTDLAIE
jgi:carbon-monoxide dehydrogenase large subunit